MMRVGVLGIAGAAAAVLTLAAPGVADAGTPVWAVQTVPLPPGSSTADLAGVSCPTLTICTAAGNSNAGGSTIIAERWDGSAWTAQNLVDPTGDHAQMSAVSCASAT